MKSHSKHFICEQCGRNFSHKSQLNEHMLWHESPEAFVCPICGMQLKDKRILRKHIVNVHEARAKGEDREKKFPCPICEYTSDYKSNLKNHVKKHDRQQEKLKRNPNCATCSICPAVLENELCLKIHMKKVHVHEKLKCDFCELVLKTKGSLWSHYRNKHNFEPKVPKPKKERKPREYKKRPPRKRKPRKKKNAAGENEEEDIATGGMGSMEHPENVNIIAIQNVYDVNYGYSHDK